MTLPPGEYPVPIATVPTIWRGDPFQWKLPMVDHLDAPVDLTAFGTAWASTLRVKEEGTLEVDFAVDVTHLAAGYIVLSLSAAQTRAMTAPTYRFDVEASGGAVTPWTVWRGEVAVDGDYTRSA